MDDTFSSCITVAMAELRTARKLLNTEITNYPAPIAGCDAQFNHLIGERQKVLEAIQTLEDVVFVPTPRSPTPQAGVESR